MKKEIIAGWVILGIFVAGVFADEMVWLYGFQRYDTDFIHRQKSDAIENYELCRDGFGDPKEVCKKAAVNGFSPY